MIENPNTPRQNNNNQEFKESPLTSHINQLQEITGFIAQLNKDLQEALKNGDKTKAVMLNKIIAEQKKEYEKILEKTRTLQQELDKVYDVTKYSQKNKAEDPENPWNDPTLRSGNGLGTK